MLICCTTSISYISLNSSYSILLDEMHKASPTLTKPNILRRTFLFSLFLSQDANLLFFVLSFTFPEWQWCPSCTYLYVNHRPLNVCHDRQLLRGFLLILVNWLSLHTCFYVVDYVACTGAKISSTKGQEEEATFPCLHAFHSSQQTHKLIVIILVFVLESYVFCDS